MTFKHQQDVSRSCHSLSECIQRGLGEHLGSKNRHWKREAGGCPGRIHRHKQLELHGQHHHTRCAERTFMRAPQTLTAGRQLRGNHATSARTAIGRRYLEASKSTAE
jgi:hypothetical protein